GAAEKCDELAPPLVEHALSSGGRPNRSPAQVRGRSSRNVYPQKRHNEDQNRIKPGFHDVDTPIPPSLLYRLRFQGGSPWAANHTHASPQHQPAIEPRVRSLG